MTPRFALALTLTVALVGLNPGVRADQLTIGSSPALIGPIVGGSTTTGNTAFVTIANNTAQDQPANFMSGASIKLSIAPDPTVPATVGTVTFAGFAAGSNNITPPPNYVFAGQAGSAPVANFIPSDNTLGGRPSLGYNDVIANLAGIQVPIGPSNLLTLNFTASANATGTFVLQAIPSLASSVWTDPQFASRPYANVPTTGSPVTIGRIVVTPIPEPATCTLICLAGLSVAAGARRLRRRTEFTAAV